MEIINKNLRWFVVLVFIGLVFFLVKSDFSKKKEAVQIHSVKIADKIIKVDLALTQKEQERGLSGRKSLAENEGMLFVFSKPAENYFWMKDMFFPIDIIWIDDNFNIVFIEKNALPESYPETFGPNKKSKYVLELGANFAEKNNLKENERVTLLP